VFALFLSRRVQTQLYFIFAQQAVSAVQRQPVRGLVDDDAIGRGDLFGRGMGQPSGGANGEGQRQPWRFGPKEADSSVHP
jgi:hypothetical protein